MIKDFFLDKFKFDFENNKKFIECIEELDFEVSNFVIRSFSHIINVHHIWISRLLNNELESHSNDILPLEYWMRLAHDNYLKSIDYIEKYELESKVNYHDSENVKYGMVIDFGDLKKIVKEYFLRNKLFYFFSKQTKKALQFITDFLPV